MLAAANSVDLISSRVVRPPVPLTTLQMENSKGRGASKSLAVLTKKTHAYISHTEVANAAAVKNISGG